MSEYKDMTGQQLIDWIVGHNAQELKVRVGYVTPKGEYTTSVIMPSIDHLDEPADGYYLVL